MYESVPSLVTLQMTNQDLFDYLARAQSTIDVLKLMLVSDDLILKQVLVKFGNMIMVFILHSVPKEHGKIPPFLGGKTY